MRNSYDGDRIRLVLSLGLLVVLASCRAGTNTTTTAAATSASTTAIVTTTTLAPTVVTATTFPATTEATTTPTSPPATPVVHTDQSCNASPSQPWNGTANGLPEIQGSARSGEFWALVEGGVPLPANEGTKIIWKMSGDVGGNLQLIAEDTDGNRLGPIWGPEPHMGSNWARLGSEWGAGFEFPHSGCWDVQASSGNNTGDIWFDVSAIIASDQGTPAETPTAIARPFPIPSACKITTPSAPRADRWGLNRRWWSGDGLMATSNSEPLFASLDGGTVGVSNDFRWDLAQRAPLRIAGYNLDQPDQTLGNETDLSQSLSTVYPTEIEFPSSGCWQLHAEAGQQSLDFTVYVYPYGCLPPDQRVPGSSITCERPEP